MAKFIVLMTQNEGRESRDRSGRDWEIVTAPDLRAAMEQVFRTGVNGDPESIIVLGKEGQPDGVEIYELGGAHAQEVYCRKCRKLLNAPKKD